MNYLEMILKNFIENLAYQLNVLKANFMIYLTKNVSYEAFNVHCQYKHKFT